MSKDWRTYAMHILDSIAKIRRISDRGEITSDEVLYDAALRNLQTLSEATQRLPGNLKAEQADIPWKEISGFRNILVHNYLGDIDPEAVAQVVDKHLPPLEQAVRKMLEENE
ncbi:MULTISPECIES: HepT-like ribonuclease domain-containing protein [unclassified Microbulbifer]|uniref:HepT-like ribonuclease domain-containing protein n=1 Tax=unclassified Microbulbifer TaxID=2619833 RepID=UPI0027E41091|nr:MULTISPECIES: HepT-like ribonuclease domain-containing protein [unclassified Microbulbifer]